MAEDNMSNILNNFKNIINSSSSTSDNNNNATSATSNNNFNINPDMVKNLADMIKNNNFKNQASGFKSTSSNISNSEDSSNAFDVETILKIKSIMETLNQTDDPRSNLLYSLKPYLRESRRSKIDQYVNMFKITKVSNLFKNEKGDNK